MKKFIIIILLFVATSCVNEPRTDIITLQSMDDGKIIHSFDVYKFSKVKDTLIISKHLRNDRIIFSVYGAYVGILPKNTNINNTNHVYYKMIRIK